MHFLITSAFSALALPQPLSSPLSLLLNVALWSSSTQPPLLVSPPLPWPPHAAVQASITASGIRVFKHQVLNILGDLLRLHLCSEVWCGWWMVWLIYHVGRSSRLTAECTGMVLEGVELGAWVASVRQCYVMFGLRGKSHRLGRTRYKWLCPLSHCHESNGHVSWKDSPLRWGILSSYFSNLPLCPFRHAS